MTVYWCTRHNRMRADGLANICTWGLDAQRNGFDDFEDCELVKARVTFGEGRPDPALLLGVTEIAERLEVQPNTVSIWRLRHPSFPEPLVSLSMGPVWYWPDIQQWVESRSQ